ncbi:FtsX-like permease family protein [Bacteroidales bacterium OttesenSCG-928-L19]|nr:FtsX-like permease family protein [Bacteroidales bacterium OttesenSCG-928-L19]
MKRVPLKTAFFIAWRYLFSKKKHNLINVVSLISMIGVAASSAAIVIVLSAFNGIEQLVSSNFNAFNPDIKITLSEGKSFPIDTFLFNKISSIEGVTSVHEVVSDLVLLHYDDKEALVALKGISESYPDANPLRSMLIDGDMIFNHNGFQYGYIGAGVAGTIHLNLRKAESLQLYYPKRTKKNFVNPADAFQKRFLIPGGVFVSNTEYDERYLFCDIAFARELMSYENEVTQLEVFISPKVKLEKSCGQIQELLGDDYIVQDRYQQEELLFKTMKSEKLIIIIILSFILLIAAFNIIGTLGMLITEKRDDIAVLKTLGASSKLINRIFTIEGILISAMGGLIGVILGILTCWIQETFHIIKLGSGDNLYIINYYPVAVEMGDIFLVLGIVLIISLLASFIPAKIIEKREVSK